MEVTGTIHGRQITLDQPPSLPEGTRVNVDISPIAPVRRGSPAAILSLAGTLSDEEAAQLSTVARECRRVDPTLWNGRR